MIKRVKMINQQLAEFVDSTSFNQLPDSVIEKTKECFTDFLGVAMIGSYTQSGDAIKSIIPSEGPSTVIGYGRSSVQDAGLANGIFAHSLDLDDGHRQGQLHPGACVIPAALSLCEALDKSGEELIESLVVGYQVAIVVGMMVNPEHRSRGFHTTGTCGTLGAAAAACKALGLDQNQTVNALGLAGTQAAGLLESDHSGSMGKHLHAGRAAQSGIISAQLAENGYTGAKTIFEGDEGFLKVMAGIDPGEIDINLLMKKYRILEVYFKIYPVCRHLHSSIDASLNIIREKQIHPREIQKIMVDTYKIAAEHDNYHPTSTESLKQSLPASISVALLNEYHGLNNLTGFQYPPDNKDLSSEISLLSQKITVRTDEVFDENYPTSRSSKVTIFTDKGFYEKLVEFPYGEAENPLNKMDMEGKFENLNPKLDIEVLQIIDNMKSYDSINYFMDDLNSFLVSN